MKSPLSSAYCIRLLNQAYSAFGISPPKEAMVKKPSKKKKLSSTLRTAQ
ncbi:MAG: hypothetical protein SGI71_11040 [Verrucomicrobiota bacterium]|nr:hypothetical protein [Verrucomicrobiota bacterium]